MGKESKDKDQGVQGVQGIQGIAGVQGIPGKVKLGEKGDPGEKGERGETGKRGNLPRPIIGSFVVIVLLATVVLGTLAWQVVQTRDLVSENRQRIADIEDARIVACRHTYNGVREVFKPFFPPKKGRTAKQQDSLDKFNRTVDRLVRRCPQQVDPPLSKETKQ